MLKVKVKQARNDKKKTKKTRSKKSSRLHEVLEQHYEGYRYKRNLADHDSKRHALFNKKLRSFLVDCDKKEFIPSKSYVEKEILKIREEVDYEITMQGIDLDSIDPVRIDNNLVNMDFNTMVYYKSEDQDSVFRKQYFRAHGLVPLSRLTNKDIDFLKDAFGELGTHHEEEGYLLIDLMNVLVSKIIDEDKKDKICDMLQRKVRQIFMEYSESQGMSTEFKYSFIQKIKDKWLDGDI